MTKRILGSKAVALASCLALAATPALADDSNDGKRGLLVGADAYLAAPIGGVAQDASNLGVGVGARGEYQFSKAGGLMAKAAMIYHPGKDGSGYRSLVSVPFILGIAFAPDARKRWFIGSGFGGAVNYAAVDTVFGKDSELQLAFAAEVSLAYRRGSMQIGAHYCRTGIFGARGGGGIAIMQPSTNLMLSAGFNFTTF